MSADQWFGAAIIAGAIVTIVVYRRESRLRREASPVVPLDDLMHEQDSAEAYDDLPEQVTTAAVMDITNIEVSDEPPAEVMDTIRRLTAGTRNMLITQADYDALPELDPDVTYLIMGEVQRVENEEAFSFSFEVTNPEAFRAAFDPQMVSHLRSDVCGEIAADEAQSITDEWERLATKPASEWPGGAS